MKKRTRDIGGSDLYLADGIEAQSMAVPQGYRHKAALTVVEMVPPSEAREVLEMLGIGAAPEVHEVGEPRA